MTAPFFITLAAAYLLGSIPFGLLLTKAAGLGDIRGIGSGNIGATNVMRTGRRGLGIATLVLDAGKGFLAVWLAHRMYDGDAALIAGLAAVLGHVFPAWLKFKGGKGVATALGVIFALNASAGLIACGAWLAVFSMTRYSSLSSLAAAAAAAGTAYALDTPAPALLFLALALLIAYTHRGNIQRLLAGREHNFRKG